MGEFLSKTVGNLRLHGYPDPRRSGSVVPFARNFATGPDGPVPISTGGTTLEWNAIDSTGTSGTEVPITPISTGVVRISAVITIKSNFDTETESASVTVLVDDVAIPIPEFEAISVVPSGFAVMSVLAEVTGLVLGNTTNVSILLTSSNQTESETLSISSESSSIELEEVPAATG